MNPFGLDAVVPRVYSHVRMHIGALILAATLSSMLFVKDETIAKALLMACGLLAVGLMLFANWRSTTVQGHFGPILDFSFGPHPMASLAAALEKSGVPLSEVDLIKLMSARLDHTLRYLREGDGAEQPFEKRLRANPSLLLEVFGPADNANITSGDPQVRCVRTGNSAEHSLTEHKNLIYTKQGAVYLWYEPYHNVINDRQCFTGGAYLIQITDSARVRVETEFAQLAAGKVPENVRHVASPELVH